MCASIEFPVMGLATEYCVQLETSPGLKKVSALDSFVFSTPRAVIGVYKTNNRWKKVQILSSTKLCNSNEKLILNNS